MPNHIHNLAGSGSSQTTSLLWLGKNSNRRPRLSKSNEHRDVTMTRNIFPRHCVWERLAAPRSEESVKASSDGNAAAPVSGRRAQPGSASPVTVRENVPGMPPVSNQSQWLFVLFFSPDTVVRGVQKPFEHLRVCVLFFFYLPVTERRRAKIASCRQSGRSAETKWKWDCMYKSIFKKFHEWWLLVYIPRSCKSSGNSE